MSLETNPYYNYYTLKDNTFSTKLFTILVSRKLDNEYPIEWHLPNFDLELNKLNLLEEPTESLSSLYLKRALELRNTYDYLILLYSGGHDSHNILETFMFNGIFIDEIIILDQFDRTFRQVLENKDFEFLHQNAYEAELCAIPLAKYFIDTYSPKTKLTIVENSFGIHANYWKNLSEKEMTENLSIPGTLGITGKPLARIKDLNQYNPLLKKIKETKKVAHIWGRDKVILRHDDIGYFFVFVDGAIVDYINAYNNLTKDDLPQEIEYFYTHPTMAKAIIKQAHRLANSLPFYTFNYKLVTRNYENIAAKIIYDRKIEAPYLGLKAGDFKDWTKYLNKKRDMGGDLSLFNMTELVLFKTLDEQISYNFNKQTSIIAKLLKSPDNFVEKCLSANYSTKKYYIKYFKK